MSGPFENLGKLLDNFITELPKIVKKIVQSAERPNWTSHDYSMQKFVLGLESRGSIIDGFAYLIVYNETKPSESVILKERI